MPMWHIDYLGPPGAYGSPPGALEAARRAQLAARRALAARWAPWDASAGSVFDHVVGVITRHKL